MNIRRSQLVKTLVVVLPLALCGAFWAKSRPRESRVNIIGKREPGGNIVGKWHAISNSTWTKDHFYEFFADGRYTEKGRELNLGGTPSDSYHYWSDYSGSGYYQVSPDNMLTMSRSKAGLESSNMAMSNSNMASANAAAYIACTTLKLRIGFNTITVDFWPSNDPPETWYRMKSDTSIQKDRVGKR